MSTGLDVGGLKCRLAEIRRAASQTGADGVLLSHPADLRWACGFTGSNGLLLVTPEIAAFVTDGRYREQAAEEVREASLHVSGRSLTDALPGICVGLEGRKVLLHAERTPLQVLLEVKSAIPDVEWAPDSRLLDKNRAQKAETELALIRKAQALTERVFEDVLHLIQPGISERDLAAEIIYRCLRSGAEAMAFDPIVASGPNGALPHARPTQRRIQNGDVVILDFGCTVDGYASDMTRTISVGVPAPEVVRVHAAVADAMEAAFECVHAGRPAIDADRMARTILESAGYLEFFPHSLGHGVGLQVHEWPRLGPGSEDVLPSNCVVTIEPGVYLPHRFGVRLEDMVSVHEETAECLTRAPRQLTIV